MSQAIRIFSHPDGPDASASLIQSLRKPMNFQMHWTNEKDKKIFTPTKLIKRDFSYQLGDGTEKKSK